MLKLEHYVLLKEGNVIIKLATPTSNLVEDAIKTSRLLPETKALGSVAGSIVKPLPAIKRFGSVVGKTAVKAFS
jgi:hypothetical protein